MPANRPHSILQPLESRAECTICCMPLPLDEQQSIYEACCGKLLCRGCTVASRRALLDKTSLHKLGQVKNKLEIEELEFNLLVRTDNTPSAFCRSLRPVDNKQYIKRLQTRIDKYNDPTAMNQLDDYYIDGLKGAGKAGDREAINFLMQLYRSGHLTKQDLETTFRAKQHALEEVKSEDREFAKRFYAFCTKFGLNV